MEIKGRKIYFTIYYLLLLLEFLIEFNLKEIWIFLIEMFWTIQIL